MLKVNGKALNLEEATKDNGDIHLSEYQFGLEKLKEMFDYPKKSIRLVYPKIRIKPDPDNRGKTIKPNSCPILMEASVPGVKGLERWIYYETERFDKNSNLIHEPRRKSFNGHLVLNERNIDLAFFLIFKSSWCENGYRIKRKSDGKFGIEPYVSKDYYFAIENKKKEAAEKVNNEALVIKCKHFIYNELANDFDSLKKLAKAYGVADVNDLSMEQTQVALIAQIEEDQLRSKEEFRGWKRFLELRKDNPETDVLACINDGLEYHVIRYDAFKKVWVFIDGTDNKKHDLICKVPPANYKAPEKVLCEHLLDNKDNYELLKMGIEEAKKRPVNI